jgi:mannose-6-phosphate isomerase-like protein (cupin superfamily)
MTAVPKPVNARTWAEPGPLSGETATAALRAYAANPLFRSARFDELVIDDNPYRRPVRPDDLEWLSFDEPASRENFAQLSALLGHRMLLNIYDSSRVLLPVQMTDARWADFDLFYGVRNIERGELVRRFLEHHLFDFLSRDGEGFDLDGPAGGSAAASRLLEAVADRRTTAVAALAKQVTASPQPLRDLTMVAIQYLGTGLSAPQQPSAALARAAASGAPVDAMGAIRTAALGGLTRQCGLSDQAHSYYQFYLPSTLAVMNYLNATQHCRERTFFLLGALAAQVIDSAAWTGGGGAAALAAITAHVGQQSIGFRPPRDMRVLSESGGAAAADCPAARALPVSADQAVAWLGEHLVNPLAERFGQRGLQEFGRGMTEFATLLSVQHHDLTIQLSWINSMAECRDKAERLQRAINDHALEVDLDTFVESWEECSTTHVHDDDRLLVIESGEMTFWNCFGDNHHLKPGDKLYVPKHRLHGSVVQSGKCVYHQPVITPEINRRYG